jgi:hypothetical protein
LQYGQGTELIGPCVAVLLGGGAGGTFGLLEDTVDELVGRYTLRGGLRKQIGRVAADHQADATVGAEAHGTCAINLLPVGHAPHLDRCRSPVKQGSAPGICSLITGA